MGLFPETTANTPGAVVVGVADTGTPKGRRKLFVDLLSVVGAGSSTASTASTASTNYNCAGSDGGGQPSTTNYNRTSDTWRLIARSESNRFTGGWIGTTFASTTGTTAPSGHTSSGRLASQSMQQLSTSWEYIRPTIEPQQPQHQQQHDSIGKDEPTLPPPPALDLVPPRFIEVQKGKISLGPVAKHPPPPTPVFESAKDKEVLEARILELEDSLQRLQKRVSQSECSSPTLEKDLRDQLDSMNRSMKSKERRAMQACRDHKALQARFQRQEVSLQTLSSENQNLQQRVHQYEGCLDDVMRKVVDALVAEDNLREEVSKLKNRVRDLEAQNAALSISPATKGRDEGYCTMSSGQPPPCNGHLEDLPEEPEQMYMMVEPCSAEMEDWSMSQEELGAALEEDINEADWLWNSSSFLNSTLDSQSESISQLLENTIEYSEDEEICCKNFTRDFYKLVNIASDSTRSLQSPGGQTTCVIDCTGGEADCDTDSDDSDDDDDHNTVRTDRVHGRSPTPSEAALALVSSCSSSDASSDDRRTDDARSTADSVIVAIRPPPRTDSLMNSGLVPRSAPRSNSNSGLHSFSNNSCSSAVGGPGAGSHLPRSTTVAAVVSPQRRSLGNSKPRPSGDGEAQQHLDVIGGSVMGTTKSMPAAAANNNPWRSTGWRRVSSHQKIKESTSNNSIATKKDFITKIPPPVPARRSYAS